MKKPIKITLTLFLILLVLTPIFFFITYPFYNDIALKLKKLNIYDRTKETFITLLTTISPTPDKFKTEEFSADSIEESIKSTDIILDTKLLEELNTTLSIDNVLIEGRVFQGTSSQAMDSGFWHFPISKYPGQKGNAVIIGHRFLNLPPAKDTFFNLDKVKIGDEIVLKHDEGEWKYIVTEIKIVDENDISVVKDTDDYRLTLITCTPLWTSEKRLVVIAKLDKLYQKV
ncbi:MAG TPA: class D sortase [Candidatus Dojkabacteria bacterium]|jgi:sortase A|nr:class D sortase [Candidatus Dojkabacteria bacterium]